jgi:predicted transposase/invertase (TIGR01784 family)
MVIFEGELMAKVDCVQEACRNSFDEGESKGIAKGIAEGKIIVAKRMLDEGVDLDVISRCTGLSMVGISKLLDNLNE